ncbi:EH signature domain-containing protein [Rhodoplanes sp. SY1]|uniref:EH signature domain-containing protein n=1 Tax=Rhodoplanes sp. SY1 TaxID=3166646 RepID=UPI0038B42497
MRDAEAIVRRWLVRASLLQFLDVVEEKAEPGMWIPRRAFWEAVYKKDLIRDAWVVFDGGGAQRARRSFGNELRFATFSGVTPGQAVLILAIGTGLVVEWSFSGKCIIWEQADARDAPRLYQPTYRPGDLRHRTATDDIDKPVFAISHMGSESYNWQRKVAAKLTRMTGVRLTQADYAYRP